jgi:hydroxyacyl-ACP dehydratase HTD2-like protein with hotdog domain
MATTMRTLRRAQWLKPTTLRTTTPLYNTRRWQSDFTGLEKEMKERKITPIFDDLTPQSSYRLDTTLADWLPTTTPPAVLPPTDPPTLLPIPHHLIYFEPTKPQSAMLADGTNPDQSPGEPFVRRMWAGGRVLYNQGQPLTMDAGRGVCAEFIRSVTTKGKPGEEKLFVSIERRIARATADEQARLGPAQAGGLEEETLEHRVRQRLWRDGDTDFGPCSILETRNIVFMRARSKEQAAADAAKSSGKILKPQHRPDWTHTITPDAKLLFRFSALTFNAHAIHLDPEYCREVEGHRNLLFHGPLSYVFMVTILQQQLRRQGNEVVKSVEYRNLAPLYAHEPVTFCGTQTGENKWEIWTQTPEGGIAVKGSVVTEQGTVDKSSLGS